MALTTNVDSIVITLSKHVPSLSTSGHDTPGLRVVLHIRGHGSSGHLRDMMLMLLTVRHPPRTFDERCLLGARRPPDQPAPGKQCLISGRCPCAFKCCSQSGTSGPSTTTAELVHWQSVHSFPRAPNTLGLGQLSRGCTKGLPKYSQRSMFSVCIGAGRYKITWHHNGTPWAVNLSSPAYIVGQGNLVGWRASWRVETRLIWTCVKVCKFTGFAHAYRTCNCEQILSNQEPACDIGVRLCSGIWTLQPQCALFHCHIPSQRHERWRPGRLHFPGIS